MKRLITSYQKQLKSMCCQSGKKDIRFTLAWYLTFIYAIELNSTNSDLGSHAEYQSMESQSLEKTQFLFQPRANKILGRLTTD